MRLGCTSCHFSFDYCGKWHFHCRSSTPYTLCVPVSSLEKSHCRCRIIALSPLASSHNYVLTPCKFPDDLREMFNSCVQRCLIHLIFSLPQQGLGRLKEKKALKFRQNPVVTDVAKEARSSFVYMVLGYNPAFLSMELDVYRPPWNNNFLAIKVQKKHQSFQKACILPCPHQLTLTLNTLCSLMARERYNQVKWYMSLPLLYLLAHTGIHESNRLPAIHEQVSGRHLILSQGLFSLFSHSWG